MTGTRTIHEEVIKIDFDSEQAKARLAELQRAGEALLKLMGGPMPVFGGGGVPGVGGGGGGGGGAASSTVSTVTTAAQTQAQAATSAAVGGGPGAAPQSATVSSGAIAPPMAPASATTSTGVGGGGGGGGAPSPAAPSGGGGGRGGWGNYDPWGRPMAGVWHGGIQGIAGGTSGMARGAFSALGAVAGGGMIGSMISSLGSITGLEALSQANATRAQIERDLGMVDQSGMLRGIMDGQPGHGTTKEFDPYMTMATLQGITPEEFVSGARQYTMAAGGSFGPNRRMKRAPELITPMLAGLSPSTMGAMDSTVLASGAIGDEGSSLRLAGVGQQGFGMVGGLDRWMQSLTGQIDRLLDRGIKVSLADTASLLEAMAADPALWNLGSKAPSVVGAIGGVAADARQTLLAPFQQLGHHAVLADALQQAGGDPFKAIRVLEDPARMGQKGVRRAIGNLFGMGDLGSAAMANITRNLGLDESGALLNLPNDAASYELQTPDKKWRERSAIEANRSWTKVVSRPGNLRQHRLQVETDLKSEYFKNDLGKGFMDFGSTLKLVIDEFLGDGGSLIKMMGGTRMPEPAATID